MKIVLNTSPIIFLGKIDALKFLSSCTDEAYTPQGVVAELHEYELPQFIQALAVSDVGLGYVMGALGRLHQGELEAIVLAKELAADYVVLDDLLARRKAQNLGLQVIGTVGLLLWMEKKQLLDALQTCQKLQQLTEQHGLYLSPSLREQLTQQLLGGH